MTPDPKLVESSLSGSRDAFGQIVQRYQSLVCSIAYSNTGDLALSEDLAQETFVTAWQRLGELREWGKLRAWLAGIVRNLAHNVARRRHRDAAAKATELPADAAAAVATPLDEAITHEQEALLWRTLEEIPDTYREPLVLFYREQQSVARVAELLDLSEDAAKQRLSRGRAMLKAQVAAFVEEALEHTAPKAAFAAAVLAALPAAAPEAAAAAVAATAGKGSAAAQAAGGFGAIFGSLLGVLGAGIGVRASIANTRSTRERQFVVRMTWVVLAYVVGFMGLVTACVVCFVPKSVREAPASPSTLTALIVGVGGVYAAGLIALIVKFNRRQRQIQKEQGTYVEPRPIEPSQMSKATVYSSLGGAVLGAVCWVFPPAIMAGDWVIAGVTLAVAAATFWTSARAMLRAPKRYFAIAAATLAPLAILDLVVVNLRWDMWMGGWADTQQRLPVYMRGSVSPRWMANATIVAIFGFLAIMFVWLDYRQKPMASR